MNDTRARGALLVVALLLVGGTGCFTTAAIMDARNRSAQREREERMLALERERPARIAGLEPAANAGDPAAMLALATELLSARDRAQRDQPRALDLLGRAAALGYGPAQAALGELLMVGWSSVPQLSIDKAYLSVPRGVELMKQAATQACIYRDGSTRSLEPALILGNRAGKDPLDGALWRARSILHCGRPEPYVLANAVGFARQDSGRKTAERVEALAFVMLAGDSKAIAAATATMDPADVRAAEMGAASLRERVARSERDYPAPPRKVWK